MRVVCLAPTASQSDIGQIVCAVDFPVEVSLVKFGEFEIRIGIDLTILPGFLFQIYSNRPKSDLSSKQTCQMNTSLDSLLRLLPWSLHWDLNLFSDSSILILLDCDGPMV